MTYQVFVLNRINDLVAAARSEQDRQDAHAPVPPVRSRYAGPEILAVLLTGAALVASLLV
jgi:hypothetical protein